MKIIARIARSPLSASAFCAAPRLSGQRAPQLASQGPGLAGAAELYEPLAEERCQTLSPHGCDFILYGDRELLIQMLSNLVENACLHTPHGSNIGFGATVAGEVLTFWVQDDGPGIATEERERVLRPFYRLDASRSRPGNGLGLSLVAAIAERHGGRVTLSDADPGLRIEIRMPQRASTTRS